VAFAAMILWLPWSSGCDTQLYVSILLTKNQ